MAEPVEQRFLVEASGSEEITLKTGDEEFKFNKSSLCSRSEYFGAMFSGRFKDNNKNIVVIDDIKTPTMIIIKQFVEIGCIPDLSFHGITELGKAANFLQMDSLINQIVSVLQAKLTYSNWMEIMIIAQTLAYRNLEQYSAGYGLLEFNKVTKSSIRSVDNLYWYLSHPYLNADELSVFKFGLKWIASRRIGGDPCMLILICLDIQRLTIKDLSYMKKLIKIKSYENRVSTKIINCLYYIACNIHKGEMAIPNIMELEQELCEKFTRRIYSEVLHLVQQSKRRRELKLTAVILFKAPGPRKQNPVLCNREPFPVYTSTMCTFSETSGFEKWVDVAGSYGLSVAQWGLYKLVVVGGELATGNFIKDIRIYDTFTKSWDVHDAQLPELRYPGVAIQGNKLFIVGGQMNSGELKRVIVYDLIERSHELVASIKQEDTQNQAVCCHTGNIYASGLADVYKYVRTIQGPPEGAWTEVTYNDSSSPNIKMLVPHKEYIYCIAKNSKTLFRFRPNVYGSYTNISSFTHYPVVMCSLGTRIIAFTSPNESDDIAIEEFCGTSTYNERPIIVWSEEGTEILVNEATWSCGMVVSMLPMCRDIPKRHDYYIRRAKI